MDRFSSLTILLFIFVSFSCSDHGPTGFMLSEQDLDLRIRPAKWFNDHAGAVSLTYDAGWGSYGLEDHMENTIQEVLDRGLRLDFEMVTERYQNVWYLNDDIDDIRDRLIPSGIHFFGHGHIHVGHDEMTYEEAAESFKTCFDLMTEWGLDPKVYAYPGSSGRELETQRANREAGFIAARGVTHSIHNMLICPDDETVPENWYFLPSAPVARDYHNFYQTPEELKKVFDLALDHTAWAIVMYHSIGIEGGYGYYPFESFIQDLDNIKSMDLWSGNFDSVTLYIYERNAFHYHISDFSINSESATFTLRVSDGYENDFYNQPLTLILEISEEYPITSITIDGNQQTDPIINGSTVKFNLVPDESEYYVRINF